MLSVERVTQFLNKFAPLSLAAEWDNVGLLLGAATAPAHNVMTCLTVTPEVAEEAVAANANLIITHHPILFRGVKRLTAANAEGRMLLRLAGANVAVYSPHTAFDNCPGGINDMLARRLELIDIMPLRVEDGPTQLKIVVFVPNADLDKVSDALFAAGAGNIGRYRECSFRLAGTGTFFGSETANPTVGEKGRREHVNEWRLEVICPEAVLPAALAAIRRAHSYEEPAYDVYPLRPESRGGSGRIGKLSRPASLEELAKTVKEKLAANLVQVVGDKQRSVERVAIVCGAGGDFVGAAMEQKADVLLTGEARFHDALAAEAGGLAMLMPGHYASERCGVEELTLLLQQEFPSANIWTSRRESDPLSSL